MTLTLKQLEDMAARINAALSARNYKPTEAYAAVWVKKVKPEQVLQRIYLKGNKANGYLHFTDGKWESQGISFSNLYHLIADVIQECK